MKPHQTIQQMIGASQTRKGLIATISIATLLLTVGYLLGQLWLEVPVVFLLGVLWCVCVLREFHGVASLLFALMLGAAAIGYMARLSHVLMLAAGCASVLAWDLHLFEARLLDLDELATKEMEKSHLQRVFMVLAASFVLIAADSWLRIRFQFIMLVAVAILVILILNQIVLTVRKAGRPPAPPKA